ncbi:MULTISPECIES: cyclic nucleotide-binding/CBS domain-containing protein [Metallosphaera]|uniref:CBS domain-containing protein n=1 Tax=Metallosphaera TaxID=41980 RepID=UPI001F05FAA3|nr:CBS domain-containing protein [Metallosphaera sedula]MCH1770140.1 CBS domain-containing protein [Metallosphaera sedula]MCP6728026.1 CBS domain-containing protein [Metallosphaera sedula]
MKISDVMTGKLVRVDPRSSLKEALTLMLERNIRRLIVGNAQGIVTIRDLVYGWDNGNKVVEEVMNRDLLMISPEADAKQASKIMTKKGVGSLLVARDEEVVGIVTERDLLRVLTVSEGVNVGDVMKVDPLISAPETTVLEIIKAMKDNWERHAIVVEDNLPSGIVSIRDVGRAILEGKVNSPVSGIMKRPVFRTTPDSSLEIARKIMVQENVGFLPVVDSRALLGSVEEREILAVISI